MELSYTFDPDTLREIPESREELFARIDHLQATSGDSSGELIGLLRIAGRLDEAQKLGEETLLSRGVDVASLGGKDQLPASSLAQVLRYAHVLQWKGELEKSLAIFDQCVSSAQMTRMNAAVFTAFALQHRGKCHYDLGNFELALADFEEALKIRSIIGSPKDQIESTTMALEAALRRMNQPSNIRIV